MKRIYTLLGAVLLASATQAQMAVSKPSSDEITLSRTRSAASQSSENRGGTTSFFCEDFANGFTGNNGYGAWTYDDSGATDVWMMATAASPAGAYSSNLDPMASPSAANGWVIFDADLYQGGCFEDSKATTHENPTYNIHNSVFYCVANMPGAVPVTSTYALTNVTLPFAIQIANLGWEKALKQNPDLAKGLNTHAGKVTYKAVAEAHGYEFSPVL